MKTEDQLGSYVLWLQTSMYYCVIGPQIVFPTGLENQEHFLSFIVFCPWSLLEKPSSLQLRSPIVSLFRAREPDYTETTGPGAIFCIGVQEKYSFDVKNWTNKRFDDSVGCF